MQMNEPQVWTLIGVFATFMLGSLPMAMRQHDRMTTALHRELSATFEARFDGMDEKFTAMDEKFSARLTAMDEKFDARFTAMDEKFSARLTAMDEKFDARLTAMDEKFDARFGSVDRRLEELDKEVANLATRFWGSR